MKRLAALILLAAILAFPAPARADIAPPAQPPGAAPQPSAEPTQVRMVAETVLMDVKPAAGDSLGVAHVTADFRMLNLGEEAESMAVRFPIGASDGWSSVNELTDLQVMVDGRRARTQRTTGPDTNSNQTVPWAEFGVTFPPREYVSVRVSYTLQASGEYPFIWFKYILETGAGWNGTIGSADIIVQLPYEVSYQNVLMDPQQQYGTTPGGVADGRRIQWHYAGFVPTAQDNFEVDLVMPSAWQQLLLEQAKVTRNPRDGEAWGRLGKLSKAMAFSSRGKGFRAESGALDGGAQELYQQALQSYGKAVTLLPDDPLWHAGYAELLGYHAYFEAFNSTDTAAEAAQSLQQLQAALELAPNDPKVQEIAQEISFFFPGAVLQDGDRFVMAEFTATVPPPTTKPPPTEPAAPTSAPPPTSAPAPTSALPAQATSVPTPKPASPVCGSALLLPLLAGLVLASRRAGSIHHR